MAKAIVKHFNAPKRWFITSDTHFGAERTLELSKRPFRDVDEMDFALISNWNKKVRSKDGVIHLGDFGDFNACTKLNFGEMKFVLGNYETKNGIFKPSDKRISLLPTGSSVTFRGKKYYLTHKPIGKSMR